MLGLAQVGKGDVVVDLGSGDGRLVITAAKQFGARGIGIDIDPARIAEGRANATRAGVDGLVEFRQEDALQADVSRATVVTLYLLSSSNVKLRPRLSQPAQARAPASSRTSSGWETGRPTRSRPSPTSNGTSRTLYLWTVGANTPNPEIATVTASADDLVDCPARPLGEMADAGDSKSPARKGISVRVRERAPLDSFP